MFAVKRTFSSVDEYVFVPATTCRGSWSLRWICVLRPPGDTARSQRNSPREYAAALAVK